MRNRRNDTARCTPTRRRLGGNVIINGHEVDSEDEKILVHSILADLVNAIDVISPRDKEILSFHPTQQ